MRGEGGRVRGVGGGGSGEESKRRESLKPPQAPTQVLLIVSFFKSRTW